MSRARTLADQFNSDGDLALTPVASVNAGQIGGRRNLIINGAMTVAQRGTSGFTTNGAYTLDRHKVYVPAASFTASQSTTSPADFLYSLKVENTSVGTPSAAQGGNIFFPLEGNTVSQLNWGTSDAKTVTLSFYVRSNTTGTYCINLENSTGTIGSGSHSYVAEYTINSANTWERKQITIPGPTVGTWATNNTMSIVIGWTLETGSNLTTATTDAWQSGTYRQTSNQAAWQQTNGADFHLTGAQLELGSQASDFEHRSYGEELFLCKRYYQYIGGDTAYQNITTVTNFTGGVMVGPFSHEVELRAVPSITKSGDWQVLGGNTTVGQTISADQNGKKSVQIGFSDGSGGTSGYSATLRVANDSNFRLTFDAEL